MFEVDQVTLTIEEARNIASMLRFPSHWEASELRRTGLRLERRVEFAEEQNASRKRLVEMYPGDGDDAVTALGKTIAAVEFRKEREG